jgi:hypothetical protein
MGWDAFAVPLKANWGLENPECGDREFDAAVKAARKDRTDPEPQLIDGLLVQGGLDCSACGEMLERATGRDVYAEDPWSAEEVKRISAEADWTFEVEPTQEWAKRSAKAFLERCAELDRGIRFSY